MAGADTDEIVVGASGKIMVAPVGTTAPADVGDAWPAGWIDVGYASDDGVTFRDSKTLEEIKVWQLFYAARRIVTERDAQAEFALRQWNKDTVKFAFGGGTVTALVAPDTGYKYSPPAPETIDERALGIEWTDGAKHYRIILPRGMATEQVETKLTRSDAADLPVTFGVVGQSGVDPWYLLTDDPAFA